MAVLVVDLLEPVAVHQQQAQPAGGAVALALLQVGAQAAAVEQAGQLVAQHHRLGAGELVVGRAQAVECALQLGVPPPQAPDQELLIEHHARDRPAQEVRHHVRTRVDQALELLMAYFQQLAVRPRACRGTARVVADQQPQLAEELPRPEGLFHQVLAEVELHLPTGDDVHRRAQVAAPEQHLAGPHRPGPCDPREQGVLRRRKLRRSGVVLGCAGKVRRPRCGGVRPHLRREC